MAQTYTVVSTDANGHYAFSDLRPGTYTITETQPSGFFTANNTIGTQGGTVGPNDTLTNIVLQPGINGTGNNFGELPAGSLSGFVYWDLNHNGVMDSADFGIVNVLITLVGVDVLGIAVHATTRTDTQWAYEFTALRPGTYSLIETQPPHFRDYKDNLGTLGGQTENDEFSSIVMPWGAAARTTISASSSSRKSAPLPGREVGDKVSPRPGRPRQGPRRFDRNHPKVGPLLAQGQVPRGVGGYPRGPLAYSLVPTLGTKRLVWRRSPKSGKPNLIGIANFDRSARL